MHIMLLLDLSQADSRARAEECGVRDTEQRRLRFANGFESYAAYAGEVVPLMKQAGQQVLRRALQRALAGEAQAETVLLETLGSRLADLVAEQAKAWGAELIVIGTHGRRGVGRLFMGSDAEQILRTSAVPELLVRAPDGGAVERAPVKAESGVPG